MQEREIGKITHYYSNINVGIVALSDTLKAGEDIHIKGHTSDFTQKVESIETEHKSVPEAKSGEIIGIKVANKVHPHDVVYRITP